MKKSVYDPRIRANCLLAINNRGVFFLDKDEHVKLNFFLFFFSFKET